MTMAAGRPFLCSANSSLYFALFFLFMSFSRLSQFSNSWKRCLDPCHTQQIVFQGEDCVHEVIISSSLKRPLRWISHASRSNARVSYYCNSVATFHPIIKLIYDIELNPGPVQASVDNKKPSSNELRSFRLRVVSPTVCSPTSRVDSPTSNMTVHARLAWNKNRQNTQCNQERTNFKQDPLQHLNNI